MEIVLGNAGVWCVSLILQGTIFGGHRSISGKESFKAG